MTDPGNYNYRLVLQTKVVTRDAIGGDVVSWVERMVVWGSAEPLQGAELLSAQQIQAEMAVRFRIYYRKHVAPTWRVLWEGVPYDVLSVIDTNGEHWELQLMCATGMRDG